MPSVIIATSYVSANLKLKRLEDFRHSLFKVPNSVLNVCLPLSSPTA